MKPPCRTAAFTLVEVMIASLVLLFGILTAIHAMQRGLDAMDRARRLGAATQAMQSEIERLRLRSWAQLAPLAGTGPQPVVQDNARLMCMRTVTSPKPDMLEIILTATWTGHDGRPHATRLVTRYARHGLNDYLHPAD